jgi:CIC family chloride channel protein
MATRPSTLGRIVGVTLFGISTGTIASLAAIGFVDSIDWLNDLLFISPRSRVLAGNASWLPFATIAVPALGGLIVGLLCYHLIPERRAHGPADIIASCQTSSSVMPTRSGVVTALASLVALGSGASVGQYGPLAHMGATLGSAAARVFRVAQIWGRIGIGCGVAAAISTAFNAPIAGIIFAHEVVLRHYSLRAFAPITVASTMGFIISNVVYDRDPLYRIQPETVAHAYEFLFFIIIGVCGALVAVAFMRAIFFFGKLASSLKIPIYLKPMLAGTVVGVAGIWLPDILGIGKETLRFATIEGAFSAPELAVTLVAKILATAICIGFGFAGGVFSPALLIGVLFGALASTGMEWVADSHHSNIAIYAICGMVAVTSPVIGAPLATILIVFELTRNYDLTTAAMVSVVFSNVVAYRVFGRSFFDVQLSRRGLDLSMGSDKVVLCERTIARYVTQEFTHLSQMQSLEQCEATLVKTGRAEGYVVDAGGLYIGKVSLNHLLRSKTAGASPSDDISTIADRNTLVFTQDTSLWVAMEEMGNFVGESIPVIRSRDDSELVGVIFEASIVKAYLDVQNDVRRDQHEAT